MKTLSHFRQFGRLANSLRFAPLTFRLKYGILFSGSKVKQAAQDAGDATRRRMMKVKNIGSNQTQIDKSDGTSVLVSYSTPVAAFVPGRGYIKTSNSWSRTTSKHINQWIGGKAEVVSQSELEALIG